MAVAVTLAVGCPKPPTGVPDPSQSEVAVDRPTGAVADGRDQVQIRVTVRDSTGAPLSGVVVQLAATGTGNTLLQPTAPSDADGLAVGALATTVAERKTITATLPPGPIPSQPDVVFDAPFNGVQGTRSLHYVTDHGVVNRPQDLSGATIGAYVPDGGSGYTYLAGTGTDAGTFQIPDVPQSQYILRLDTKLIETSARTVDLSEAIQGRPDRVPSDAETRVHVQVTGMTPWTEQWVGSTFVLGNLHLTAPNAGIRIAELEQFSEDGGLPNEGQTDLDLIRSYQTTGFPRSLIEASKGDEAYVVQYTIHDAGYHVDPILGKVSDSYKSVASISGPLPLTIVDNQINEVAATLSPTSPQQLPVAWQVAENTPGSFTSYRTDVNPNAATSRHSFRLNITQTGLDRRNQAESLVMGILSGRSPQYDRSMAIEYGDPFPTSWVRFAVAQTDFTVALSRGFSTTGSITVSDLLPTFPATPLRPQVSPVKAATVEGVSLFSDQTLATATPLIRWSPPAVGTPTDYAVKISEFSATSTVEIADIQTTGTQFVVPPGFLLSGRFYNVTITAVVAPTHSLQTTPLMYPWPYHSADAVGGVLTMP